MTEVYRKDQYSVVVNEDNKGYSLINLSTGVVEYESTSLPRCMVVADESADYFERHAQYETKEAAKEVKSASIVSIVPKDSSD